MVPVATAVPEEFSSAYCAPVAAPLASRNASFAPLAAYPTWLTRTEPATAADAGDAGAVARAAATSTAATSAVAAGTAMASATRGRIRYRVMGSSQNIDDHSGCCG